MTLRLIQAEIPGTPRLAGDRHPIGQHEQNFRRCPAGCVAVEGGGELGAERIELRGDVSEL
jgi:hypothetical protein